MLTTALLFVTLALTGKHDPLPEIVSAFGMDIVPEIQGYDVPATSALLGMHDPRCDGCGSHLMVSSHWIDVIWWGPYYGDTDNDIDMAVGSSVWLDKIITDQTLEGYCDWLYAGKCAQVLPEDGCVQAFQLKFTTGTNGRVEDAGGTVIVQPNSTTTVSMSGFYADCGGSFDTVVWKVMSYSQELGWSHQGSITIMGGCTLCAPKD